VLIQVTCDDTKKNNTRKKIKKKRERERKKKEEKEVCRNKKPKTKKPHSELFTNKSNMADGMILSSQAPPLQQPLPTSAPLPLHHHQQQVPQRGSRDLKDVCRYFNTPNGCMYKERCLYLHVPGVLGGTYSGGLIHTNKCQNPMCDREAPSRGPLCGACYHMKRCYESRQQAHPGQLHMPLIPGYVPNINSSVMNSHFTKLPGLVPHSPLHHTGGPLLQMPYSVPPPPMSQSHQPNFMLPTTTTTTTAAQTMIVGPTTLASSEQQQSMNEDDTPMSS
jgi:hypothetical protein